MQAYAEPYVVIYESWRWEDGQYVVDYTECNTHSRLTANIAGTEWYWDYSSPRTLDWVHDIEVPTQSLQEQLHDGEGLLALTLTSFYDGPIINGRLPWARVTNLDLFVDASPEPVNEPSSIVALISAFGYVTLICKCRFRC